MKLAYMLLVLAFFAGCGKPKSDTVAICMMPDGSLLQVDSARVETRGRSLRIHKNGKVIVTGQDHCALVESE